MSGAPCGDFAPNDDGTLALESLGRLLLSAEGGMFTMGSGKGNGGGEACHVVGGVQRLRGIRSCSVSVEYACRTAGCALPY